MQKFPLHLYKFDQCKIVKCKYINVGWAWFSSHNAWMMGVISLLITLISKTTFLQAKVNSPAEQVESGLMTRSWSPVVPEALYVMSDLMMTWAVSLYIIVACLFCGLISYLAVFLCVRRDLDIQQNYYN